ncbi:hypothetical protein [Vibrio navarrensis]|uniref:SH3 domain-containing protein n=1 Tax=Vibrio navarrensis TaxID=29495 RepID=A0AAJ4IFX8_9VIBR|nr:hypothetical protein I3X05_18350 [Vibrio navarrensis]
MAKRISYLLLFLLLGCAGQLSNTEHLQHGYQSLSENKLDSAQSHFEQSLKGYEASGVSIGQFYALTALGELELAKDQPQSAIEYFRNASEFEVNNRLSLDVSIKSRHKAKEREAYYQLSKAKNDASIYHQYLSQQDPDEYSKLLINELTRLTNAKDVEGLEEFSEVTKGSYFSRQALFSVLEIEYEKLDTQNIAQLRDFIQKYNDKKVNTLISEPKLVRETNLYDSPQFTNVKARLTPVMQLMVIESNSDALWVTLENQQHGWVMSKDVTLATSKEQQIRYQSITASSKEAIRTILYKDAMHSKDTAVLVSYLGQYKAHSSASDVKNRLVGLYREQKSVQGYRNAFKWSGDSNDLSSEYVLIKGEDALLEFVKLYSPAVALPVVYSAKSELIGLYRSKQTVSGFQNAYLWSKENGDLKSELALLTSEEQLIAFSKRNTKNSEISALAKVKLLSLYRTQNTYASLKKAYDLSGEKQDLASISKILTSENDYEKYLKDFAKTKYQDVYQQTKETYVALLRDKGQFLAQFRAYQLTLLPSDGQKSQQLAKTTEHHKTLEAFAFESIKNKDGLFRLELTDLDSSVDGRKISRWGLASEYSYEVNATASVGYQLRLGSNATFIPEYHDFNVVIEFSFNLPLEKEVKAKLFGTSTTKPHISLEQVVSSRLSSDNATARNAVRFGAFQTAYFDRGTLGGYTAVYPDGVAKISAEIKSVSLVAAKEPKAKGTQKLAFSAFAQLPSAPRQSASMYSVVTKTGELYNQFIGEDTKRMESRRYASTDAVDTATTAVATTAAAGAVAKSNTVASNQRGVKRVVSNGKVMGAASYRVECTQGSDHIIYFWDGEWNHGFLGRMGLNNLSQSEIEKYVCTKL